MYIATALNFKLFLFLYIMHVATYIYKYVQCDLLTASITVAGEGDFTGTHR